MSSELVIRTNSKTFEVEQPLNYTGRYQIFRGLSPTSTSRLEGRLAELQNALELEKQARIKAEKQVHELMFRFNLIENEMSEIDGLSLSQEEIVRQREQEISNLRNDLETTLNLNQLRQSDADNKYQHDIRLLVDQLEKSNKSKESTESAHEMLHANLVQMSMRLDAISKEKNLLEIKNHKLNDQLRTAQISGEEQTRQINDLNNQSNHLNNELTRLKNSIEGIEGEKFSLKNLVAQLKINLEQEREKYDEECRQRNDLGIQLTNLQIAHDSLFSKCGELVDLTENLKLQVAKSNVELVSARSKHETEVKSYAEDIQANKWKYAASLKELEDRLRESRNEINKKCEEKNSLQVLITNFENQINYSNAEALGWAMRVKQATAAVDAAERRLEEQARVLDIAKEEKRTLQTEILRMRQIVGELTERIESLIRENKRLQELELESRSTAEDLETQLVAANAAKKHEQQQFENLVGQHGEAKSALKEAVTRIEQLARDKEELKSSYELRIQELNVKMEALRSNNDSILNEARRSSTESETKFSVEIGRIKSKFEGELKGFEVQLNQLAHANTQITEQNSILTTKIREYELRLDEEGRRFEEISRNLTLSEERKILLNQQLEDTRIQLENAERARRRAEADLAEAESTVADLSRSISTLQADRKTAESEVQSLTEHVSDLERQRADDEDLIQKLKAQNNRLTEELSNEKQTRQSLDEERLRLESEVKNLSSRIQDVEMLANKEYSRTLTNLQNKLKDQGLQLATEQMRSRDLGDEVKRLQRLLQDARSQLEAEIEVSQQAKQQLATAQHKISTLKRQLNDAEENANLASKKVHRLERQLSDVDQKSEEHLIRIVTRPPSHQTTPVYHLVPPTRYSATPTYRVSPRVSRSVSMTRCVDVREN